MESDLLKVLVIGPPASGYTEVAQRISTRIGAPFIDPFALVEEAKKETSEFGDEIRTMIEENENIVSNEVICKVAHHRMDQHDCRNNGWVISGFSDSMERAAAIFDIGEEKQHSPHFEHIPTHVIILDADDKELEKRAELKNDDMETFRNALERYNSINKDYNDDIDNDYDDEDEDECNYGENKSLIAFCDRHDIPSLICDAFGEIDDFIDEFLKSSKSENEIEIEYLKFDQEKKKTDEKEEEKNCTKEEEGKKNQIEGSAHECYIVDDEFLENEVMIFENYFNPNVMEKVLEGLIHLAKEMPKNPLKMLGEFLLANSGDGNT